MGWDHGQRDFPGKPSIDICAKHKRPAGCGDKLLSVAETPWKILEDY